MKKLLMAIYGMSRVVLSQHRRVEGHTVYILDDIARLWHNTRAQIGTESVVIGASLGVNLTAIIGRIVMS